MYGFWKTVWAQQYMDTTCEISSLVKKSLKSCKEYICGIKNDVSNKKFWENPKAFFTQCFGHALNVECTVFERQYGHSNIWTQHKKFPVLLKNLSKVMQCYRKFEKTYR